MLKKLLLPLFTLTILGTTLFSTPVSAAAPDCSESFLGMPSWCNGVNLDASGGFDVEGSVITIALNILNAITVLATYLVIGYVIYGGYLYIFSGGDTGKVATGKKALNQAFIGLAITLSASVIFNALRIALAGNSEINTGVDSTTAILNLFNWLIGMGGIVATIFVVGGGILYVTSKGEPAKLQKAKQTIYYALIGLVIVALAFAITGFMQNTINNANETSLLINNAKGIIL